MDEMTRRKVELRAEALFAERGGANGYQMEDWRRAEREIAAPKKKAAVKIGIKTVTAKKTVETSKKAVKKIVSPNPVFKSFVTEKGIK